MLERKFHIQSEDDIQKSRPCYRLLHIYHTYTHITKFLIQILLHIQMMFITNIQPPPTSPRPTYYRENQQVNNLCLPTKPL